MLLSFFRWDLLLEEKNMGFRATKLTSDFKSHLLQHSNWEYVFLNMFSFSPNFICKIQLVPSTKQGNCGGWNVRLFVYSAPPSHYLTHKTWSWCLTNRKKMYKLFRTFLITAPWSKSPAVVWIELGLHRRAALCSVRSVCVCVCACTHILKSCFLPGLSVPAHVQDFWKAMAQDYIDW